MKMGQMWKKLGYDLRLGWKIFFSNGAGGIICFLFGCYSSLWVEAQGIRHGVIIENAVVILVSLLAYGTPLQMDKAMHLCPMDRREKKQYLLRFYLLRLGVSMTLSAAAFLAVCLTGLLSLPIAGLIALLQTAYGAAVLSVSFPVRKTAEPEDAFGRMGLNPQWQFSKESASVVGLNLIIVTTTALLTDIQGSIWEEQRTPNGFDCGLAAVAAVILLISAVWYVAKVLPGTLERCSDYETSCAYERAGV